MDLDKILRDSFDDGSLKNVNLQTLITLSPDKEKIKDCMKEAFDLGSKCGFYAGVNGWMKIPELDDVERILMETDTP